MMADVMPPNAFFAFLVSARCSYVLVQLGAPEELSRIARRGRDIRSAKTPPYATTPVYMSLQT